MKKIIAISISLVGFILLFSSVTLGDECHHAYRMSKSPCGCIYEECSGYYTLSYHWYCTGDCCEEDEECRSTGTSDGIVARKWPCYGECSEISGEFNKGCTFGTGMVIYGNVPKCACKK